MAELKLNFTANATPEISGWNKVTTNSTVTDLIDSNDAITSANLVASNWGGDHYFTKKPNTLGYPTDAWNVGVYVSAGAGLVSLTGLKPLTLYTFYFTASNTTEAASTTYTLTGDSIGSPISLDPTNNTDIEVNGAMTSDSSGDISISVDSSPSAYAYLTLARIVGDLSYPVSILNVNDGNPFAVDQTAIPINLGSGGNGTTQVKLVYGAIEVIQNNLTIVNDTLVTFDPVQGNIPYGVPVDCVSTIDSTDYIESIELKAITGNEYVIVSNPIYDNPAFKSVLDLAPGPIPVDGDQLEIQDSTNEIVIYPSGVYEIDPSGPETFQVRRWSITDKVWGDYVTISLNPVPIVTAPASHVVEVAYGTGLAKNDESLLAWGDSATVVDDIDTLTAAGDFSSLTDPIFPGVYVVYFYSEPDSHGGIGNDTSQLVVNEGPAPNAGPEVTAPADLNIEFDFGNGGLAKNDATLVAWLASAIVTDDTDVGLTAPGDLSALADPIPAGTHVITFEATDSELLAGSDTAQLIINEADAPNQAPVVTAPSNITIEFATGGSGLAKNDPSLLAWIALATVTDDTDVVTVSADLSALADPIPVGTHEITFNSSLDSGGLAGSDIAYLTVQEEQGSTLISVNAPGFSIVDKTGFEADLYIGRDNTIEFVLTESGAKLTDTQMSEISRLTFEVDDQLIDSDIFPGAFDWNLQNGRVVISPQSMALTAGKHRARLTLFTATYTNGVVWIAKDDLTINCIDPTA